MTGENVEFQFRDWMARNQREVEAARRQVEDLYASPERKLSLAKIEYKKAWREDALTPQIVDDLYQSFWNKKIRDSGVDYYLEIPRCDRSAEELSDLRADRRAVVLMPDGMMSIGGLFALHKMFPAMGAVDLQKGIIDNASEKGGCLDVEMEFYTPNRSTTEEEAEEFIRSQEREGQRIETYVVASQLLGKELSGEYFDSRSPMNFARLSGSRQSGSILIASFTKEGILEIDSGFPPSVRGAELGARSEGRKAI